MSDAPRRPPKVGRPPLDREDPSVGIYLKVPGKAFDDLHERAKRARVSVPDYIRQQLRDDKK